MNNECIIRKAEYGDIPLIMNFIDKYWKKDHILARSRSFFEYQHFYNNEVSFVVAEGRENKELEGILGYILYSEENERDLFGAIWKVRTNKFSMLGMKMQLFAIKNLRARTFSAIALNPSTIDMHKRWGATLGKLKHFYLLNEKNKYSIAIIKNIKQVKYNDCIEQYELNNMISESELKEICEWEKKNGKIPLKSFEYVKHRYFRHPIFSYYKYSIHYNGEIYGVLIVREIACNNCKILRIIDYLGDISALAHIGRELNCLLINGRYEYIDFYVYGIPSEILHNAGFVERNENDKNVIPNYFAPFVQKNIDIDFYTSSKDPVVLFKGDGDQDRPN